MLQINPKTCSPYQWSTVEPIEVCRQALHTRPFLLHHNLAGNPIFSVEAFAKVAEAASARQDDLHMDAGNVRLTDKWGQIPTPDVPIAEVFKHIGTADAWIIMKHVEIDPVYGEFLDDFAAFVRKIAGSEGASMIRNPEMLAIVTSPNRKTSFHFDSEINFLVQVQGTKEVWICDPQDRSITTEEEIERYYAGDITAGTYKPHAEQAAWHFFLQPGDAVHIPSHACHWVQNHDNVSVSFSLNMEFPAWHQAEVYRFNRYLRKLGITPNPPGKSWLRDRSKAAAITAVRRAKELLHRPS